MANDSFISFLEQFEQREPEASDVISENRMRRHGWPMADSGGRGQPEKKGKATGNCVSIVLGGARRVNFFPLHVLYSRKIFLQLRL